MKMYFVARTLFPSCLWEHTELLPFVFFCSRLCTPDRTGTQLPAFNTT